MRTYTTQSRILPHVAYMHNINTCIHYTFYTHIIIHRYTYIYTLHLNIHTLHVHTQHTPMHANVFINTNTHNNIHIIHNNTHVSIFTILPNTQI